MICANDQLPSTIRPAAALHAHLSQAFDCRWRRFRAAFKRCRKKCAAGSVHDLRVQGRRLLAVQELLEPFLPKSAGLQLRRCLRKLLKTFAPLRDVQVQRSRVEKLLNRFPEIVVFGKTLRRRRKKILAELSPRFARRRLRPLKRAMKTFRRSLDQFCADARNESTHAAALRSRATAAWTRVEALRQKVEPSKPATIHRMRVAFKRFRYMMELLAPLQPAHRIPVGRMQHYQTLMGDIQDTIVLQEALAKFTSKHPKKARALAVFQGALARQRAAHIKLFLAAADQLTCFKPASLRRTVRPRPARQTQLLLNR